MYSYNLQHDASYISNFFGTDGGTKSDEFSENYIKIFYDRYGCIYARKYEGQIV